MPAYRLRVSPSNSSAPGASPAVSEPGTESNMPMRCRNSDIPYRNDELVHTDVADAIGASRSSRYAKTRPFGPIEVWVINIRSVAPASGLEGSYLATRSSIEIQPLSWQRSASEATKYWVRPSISNVVFPVTAM